MVEETRILHPVDDVILDEDVGTGLVEVYPKRAVRVPQHVVNPIVADRGAGRNAQRVDAAHIAQLAPAQMMDVIVFDGIMVGRGGIVGPTPADGYARIEKVADVVVQHLVIGVQPIQTPMPA